MKRSIVCALVLVAGATAALALATKPDYRSLGTKAMKDQPGTMGGSTDMSTAKPSDSSLGTKAMKEQPGTK